MEVGDKVARLISGSILMEMTITEIDDHFIHCGPWKFDKTYGYEVDEEIGFGVPGPDGKIITGSYIKAHQD